jgi:polysaccharide biosynthesis transport protein
VRFGASEASPLAHEDGIGVLLSFVRGFLRRQYIIVILSAVLSLAAGVIYLRITPPTYTAQVQVVLANPKPQFVQQQSLVTEPAFDFTQIETQLQILKSRAIAVAVINQLKLADDPDFNGSGLSLSSLSRRVRAWVSPTLKDQPPTFPASLPKT